MAVQILCSVLVEDNLVSLSITWNSMFFCCVVLSSYAILCFCVSVLSCKRHDGKFVCAGCVIT
jgi:hypothetical protein